MADAKAIWAQLQKLTRDAPAGRVDLDLSAVTFVDGAVMSLLVALRAELAGRSIPCELVGAPESLTPLLDLYHGHEPALVVVKPKPLGPLREIGQVMANVGTAAVAYVRFTGDLTAALYGVMRRPATGNWKSLVPLVEGAGADALPIVALLNFLVGFVMAFQSSRQLELYGANVFVADVVGISMTRELAPLITAIIVCGRSGAAYAAELGTMQVSEEIDALRVMGFAPERYLILPRVVALAIVTPLLTLLGDVVGVFGGGVVGVTSLGVSPRAYLAELKTAVFAWDLGTGLVKSVAFGAAIALIGCQQGVSARGGAAGVGQRTTSTVVLCLFAIVLIDTLFTVFFRMLGL